MLGTYYMLIGIATAVIYLRVIHRYVGPEAIMRAADLLDVYGGKAHAWLLAEAAHQRRMQEARRESLAAKQRQLEVAR
jgi:hypothetical protein